MFLLSKKHAATGNRTQEPKRHGLAIRCSTTERWRLKMNRNIPIIKLLLINLIHLLIFKKVFFFKRRKIPLIFKRHTINCAH